MKPDIFKILAIKKGEQAETKKKKQRFVANLRIMFRKEMWVRLLEHVAN